MSITLPRERRSFRQICLLVVLFVAALAPTGARADGLIIPHLGLNFGGDSGSELGDAFDAKRLNWGVSFLWMGGGVFGVEGDISYSPDFFGKTDAGGSSVFTGMGNLVIGVPFGGQQGFGVRPYALVGAGVVRATGEAFDTALSFNDNKIAWDFGGGVMVFFSTHTGIRADLRYFRTFEAVDFLDFDITGESSHLDFARGSLGFILRF
jgi:Outer membrane protein beta-barrel domain